MSVKCVVVNREAECCGVVGVGGLVGDRKFGLREDRSKELLATSTQGQDESWSPGSANEQLVFDGIDLSTLQEGDKVRICPSKASSTSSAMETRCGEIARKLTGGKQRTTCIDLVYSGPRECGSGGAFFFAEKAMSLVCHGDSVQVLRNDSS